MSGIRNEKQVFALIEYAGSTITSRYTHCLDSVLVSAANSRQMSC